MRRISRPLTYANVVATLALVLVVGGGSALALTVTGAQIKSGTITYKDVKANTLTGGNIRNGSVAAGDLSTAVQTALNARGVTATATVAPGASPSFVTARTHGFTAVSYLSTGHYCLTPAAGVYSAGDVVLVSPEWSNSSGGQLVASWDYAASGCASGTIGIETTDSNNGAETDNVAFSLAVVRQG